MPRQKRIQIGLPEKLHKAIKRDAEKHLRTIIAEIASKFNQNDS